MKSFRFLVQKRNKFGNQRLLIFAAFATGMLLLVTTNAAIAQDGQAVEIANLIPWIRQNPPDWGKGILFALLGLVGALVTIFTLIGGAVPGTAGQAQIDADTERLERLSRRLEELINTANLNPEAIAAVESTVNSLRDDLRAEKWRQFIIATGFYAILGAFFATFLAHDILQAIGIGAGWTSAIGTLGIKKDYAERKSMKDEMLEECLLHTRKIAAWLKELEEKDEKPDNLKMSSSNLVALENKVKIAQHL
jgi:hypothetical protein